MRNKERGKAMKARDQRSYAELINDVEVVYSEIKEFGNPIPRDEERVKTLLTSCYWLFRLSNKDYEPLTDWYKQYKVEGYTDAKNSLDAARKDGGVAEAMPGIES
jgi:hypothetical protein